MPWSLNITYYHTILQLNETYHPCPSTTVSYFCNPGCVSQESLSVISCQLLSAQICVFTLIKGPSGSRRPIGRRRKSCNSMRNHERPNNRIGRKNPGFYSLVGLFQARGLVRFYRFTPPLDGPGNCWSDSGRPRLTRPSTWAVPVKPYKTWRDVRLP